MIFIIQPEPVEVEFKGSGKIFPNRAHVFVRSGQRMVITSLPSCLRFFHPIMENCIFPYREGEIVKLPGLLDVISVYLLFDMYFYDLFQIVFSLVANTFNVLIHECTCIWTGIPGV